MGSLRVESASTIPRGVTSWSRSRQFIVTVPMAAVTGTQPKPKFDLDKLQDVIHPSSAELAISCEQVKQGVLSLLETTDHWKDRISIKVQPWLPPQAGVLITSVHFTDGWRYELEIPEYVERRKLLRSLVQVILQEMGNRMNENQSVDIPMWLREGITENLLAREGPDIIAVASPIKGNISPQFWRVEAPTKEKVWKDPLNLVRDRLKSQPALSFSDLSVPVDDQIASVGLQHFETCSQLFVAELLRLPRGSRKLLLFIQNLDAFSHPQFAFLNAFSENFKNPLDVEKWWSVTLVSFLNRGDNSNWLERDALTKLNRILQPQLQIRTGADNLPNDQTFTIQRLISEVDYDQQRPILQQVVTQLQQLEWNLPPSMLKLVYDYHVLLANYAHKRELLSTDQGSRTSTSTTARPLIRDTLKQLEFLDILRSDFAKFGLSNSNEQVLK